MGCCKPAGTAQISMLALCRGLISVSVSLHSSQLKVIQISDKQVLCHKGQPFRRAISNELLDKLTTNDKVAKANEP